MEYNNLSAYFDRYPVSPILPDAEAAAERFETGAGGGGSSLNQAHIPYFPFPFALLVYRNRLFDVNSVQCVRKRSMTMQEEAVVRRFFFMHGASKVGY